MELVLLSVNLENDVDEEKDDVMMDDALDSCGVTVGSIMELVLLRVNLETEVNEERDEDPDGDEVAVILEDAFV